MELYDGTGRLADGQDTRAYLSEVHPVTRVYCDGAGVVCYERDNASALMLGTTPKASRITALKRCLALLAFCDRDSDVSGNHNFDREEPISVVGKLTYNQLKEQTHEVCIQSREIEQRKRCHGKRRHRR